MVFKNMKIMSEKLVSRAEKHYRNLKKKVFEGLDFYRFDNTSRHSVHIFSTPPHIKGSNKGNRLS